LLAEKQEALKFETKAAFEEVEKKDAEKIKTKDGKHAKLQSSLEAL
jgi:hypothetical protein